MPFLGSAESQPHGGLSPLLMGQECCLVFAEFDLQMLHCATGGVRASSLQPLNPSYVQAFSHSTLNLNSVLLVPFLLTTNLYDHHRDLCILCYWETPKLGGSSLLGQHRIISLAIWT